MDPSRKNRQMALMLLVGATMLIGEARRVAAIELGRWLNTRPTHPNTYQDGLPMHRGGAYAGQLESLEGHRHKACQHCRDGRCPDHCVVRPERFGFYGTQWRTWPGAGVVQASGIEELTPATPPRLELPTENEESRDPKAPVEFGVDEPAEDAGDMTLPGLQPPAPEAPAPANARPAPVPPAEAPAAIPSKESPSTELPAPERPKPSRETEQAAEEAEKPSSPEPPSEPKRDSAKDDSELWLEEDTTPEPAAKPQPEPEPTPPAPAPAQPDDQSDDENLFDDAGHRRKLRERLAVIRAEARSSAASPVPFPGANEAVPMTRETRSEPGTRSWNGVQPASSGREVEEGGVNPLRRPARSAPTDQ